MHRRSSNALRGGWVGLGICVRAFRAGDAQAVADLFVATVRSVNARDYDAAQVAAWSAAGTDPARWAATLAGRAAFVAEVAGAGSRVPSRRDACDDRGRLAPGAGGPSDCAGFADVTADGLFDHLYVSRDRQGQGVGTALADTVEAAARAAGCARLRAEVSITARPFFLARGYRVVAAQDKAAHGQLYRNYVMVKALADG